MLILLLLAGLALIPLWGLIDARLRPDWVWQQARQSKRAWTVGLAISLVLSLAGAIVGIMYLAAIRTDLAAIQRQGPEGARQSRRPQ